MRKHILALSLGALLSISMNIPIWAGQWVKSNSTSNATWMYLNDDGTACADGWYWIDGDNNGVSECYYFDGPIMLKNTTTPDGYTVDSSGRWVVDNVIQTQGQLVAPTPAEGTEEDIAAWIEKNRGTLDEFAQHAEKDYMAMKDVTYMRTVMTTLFAQEVPNGRIVYPLDNGKFVLVIRNKNRKSYRYLYYGEMQDGLRNGNGIIYRLNPDNTINFAAYSGQWSNDAPNGAGREKRVTDNGTVEISGNYTNWCQNGSMTSVETNNSKHKTRTFKYEVINGIPVVIGQISNARRGLINVVAYPEGEQNGYLTFYDSVQTAILYDNGDSRKLNHYGYWWTR